MITYRYAIDKNGNMVSIDDISDNTKDGHYLCIECKERLAPRALKSLKVSRHFYHLHADSEQYRDRKCNAEGYLHKMAKTLLADSLKNSTDPFNIFWTDTAYCRHEGADRSICRKRIDREYNIVQNTPEVSGEKRDGDFIPDILLEDKDGNKIYIEIYSTSRCSDKKLDSGNRIIEIEVKSESQIEDIVKTRKIHRDSKAVRLFNFDLDEENWFDCMGECPHEAYLKKKRSRKTAPKPVQKKEPQKIRISRIQKENIDTRHWREYISDQALSFMENNLKMRYSEAIDVLSDMAHFYENSENELKLRITGIKPYGSFQILLSEYADMFVFVFGVCQGVCYAIAQVEDKFLLYGKTDGKVHILTEVESVSSASGYLEAVYDIF